MLRLGKCEACAAKDQIILDLREQVKDALKTSLAVIDAKAYALRFAADRPARPDVPLNATAMMTSPSEFRHRRLDFPTLSQEEVEASFAAEAAEAQERAEATVAAPTIFHRRDDSA